jgi:hypothetical protein
MKKPYLVLFSIVAVVFAGYWIHDWWVSRGLVTLDAKDAPVLQVLKKVERQSGYAILARTNMAQKVTVHFRRTPVEEALSVLADQVEGRWQRVFLVGRDKPGLRKLEEKVAQQGAPFVITSMGFMGDVPENLDPEKLQKGPVKPLEGSHPLQEAALAIAVRSATPVVVQADLNPVVKAPAPSFASPSDAVRALAGAASARWELAYQFRTWGGRGRGEGGGEGGGRGRGGREGGDGGGWGRGGGEGGGGFRGFLGGDDGNTNNPTSAQAALLTDEQRAAMDKARAEMQQRFAEFQSMTPAQRAQRFAEMMDGGGSPARQQRSQQRMLARIKNTTPEQKVTMNQRFEQRLQRLQQQMSQGSAPAPKPPQGAK